MKSGKIVSQFLICWVVVMWTFMSADLAVSGSIQIGAVMPLSGIFGELAKDGLDGLTHGIQKINEEGGINGKLIELQVRDGRFTPEVQRKAFNELMSEYRPLAMIVTGPIAMPLAEEIKNGKYDTLLIPYGLFGTLAQGSMYPFVVMVGPTLGDQIRIIMKFAARSKPKAKVAMVYADNPLGRNPVKFARYYAKKVGLKIVEEKALPMKGADFSQPMSEIRRAEPDYLILNGFVGPLTIPPIRAAREAGIACPIIATHYGAYQKLLTGLGPLAKDYYVVNHFDYYHMDETPTIRKIREINAKCCPDVGYRTKAYMWGYATSLVLEDVLRRADGAGELNVKGVVKASREIKDLDTGGLTAPLTIKNNRFPVSRVWKANPQKAMFEPAPLPEGLEKWIRMGY